MFQFTLKQDKRELKRKYMLIMFKLLPVLITTDVDTKLKLNAFLEESRRRASIQENESYIWVATWEVRSIYSDIYCLSVGAVSSI